MQKAQTEKKSQNSQGNTEIQHKVSLFMLGKNSPLMQPDE